MSPSTTKKQTAPTAPKSGAGTVTSWAARRKATFEGITGTWSEIIGQMAKTYTDAQRAVENVQKQTGRMVCALLDDSSRVKRTDTREAILAAIAQRFNEGRSETNPDASGQPVKPSTLDSWASAARLAENVSEAGYPELAEVLSVTALRQGIAPTSDFKTDDKTPSIRAEVLAMAEEHRKTTGKAPGGGELRKMTETVKAKRKPASETKTRPVVNPTERITKKMRGDLDTAGLPEGSLPSTVTAEIETLLRVALAAKVQPGHVADTAAEIAAYLCKPQGEI